MFEIKTIKHSHIEGQYHGCSRVAPTFKTALYGINYRLPNVTEIVTVDIYFVVRDVKRGSKP